MNQSLPFVVVATKINPKTLEVKRTRGSFSTGPNMLAYVQALKASGYTSFEVYDQVAKKWKKVTI